MTSAPSFALEGAAAEIEAHVGAAGWDRPPTLFALVHTEQLAADEPDLAARLRIDPDARALTPIEQESLPDGPLDEALARIAWSDEVVGCALSQEIVLLPPDAQDALGDDAAPEEVAAHPERREARLVAAVLRNGSSAVVLRLRGSAGSDDDDLLTGPDLAPNLAAALLSTLH
jgi:hypothetical protein